MNRREMLGAVSLLAIAPKIAFAQANNAAETAVAAAKQFAGTEINIVWEAGLQSLDPLNYSGPKWEELTGIKVTELDPGTETRPAGSSQQTDAGTTRTFLRPRWPAVHESSPPRSRRVFDHQILSGSAPHWTMTPMRRSQSQGRQDPSNGDHCQRGPLDCDATRF